MFYFRNDISQISVFTVESVDDPETPTICHIVDGVVARLVQPAVGPSHPRTVSHLAENKIQQEQNVPKNEDLCLQVILLKMESLPVGKIKF